MLAYVLIFQWLESDFLSYLNEWDKSVGDRDGYITMMMKKKRK